MHGRKPRACLVGTSEEASDALEQRLSSTGFEVTRCALGPRALPTLEDVEPEVVLLRVIGDEALAYELLRGARERVPFTCFVGVTSHDEQAVGDAVREGAETCVFEPLDFDAVVSVMEVAVAKARASYDAARFRRRAEDTLSAAHFDSIVGAHPSMQRLLRRVAQVATTRATVLVSGESGTGKELIAAAIHQNSKRQEGPFVRLNCASLSETVLESELFGHERGAFTGATSRRAGRFEQANGGTLFLDEVSEIPKSVQVKLLRFLQEREFERVGGNETMRVDVRIVAATNKDLKACVDDGTFREDLYYRLNVVRLEVPPLRARPSDVLVLADHFLKKLAAENDRNVVGFSDEARRLLLEYPWPGNVRELQNAIEQAIILTEGTTVSADALPVSPSNEVRLMIPGATMAEIERYAILQTLKALGGSITRAAAMLGISRRTMQYRLKEWGITNRTAGYATDGDRPPSSAANEPVSEEPPS